MVSRIVVPHVAVCSVAVDDVSRGAVVEDDGNEVNGDESGREQEEALYLVGAKDPSLVFHVRYVIA